MTNLFGEANKGNGQAPGGNGQGTTGENPPQASQPPGGTPQDVSQLIALFRNLGTINGRRSRQAGRGRPEARATQTHLEELKKVGSSK